MKYLIEAIQTRDNQKDTIWRLVPLSYDIQHQQQLHFEWKICGMKEEYIVQVLQHFLRWFKNCLLCNAPLKKMNKSISYAD